MKKLFPYRTYHMDGRVPDVDQIFVFGSNLQGRHGSGAARQAVITHNAKEGIGVGRCGQSYAIPTRTQLPNKWIVTRDLNDVIQDISDFVTYTHKHTDLEYFVTAVGCGRAGFSDHQIAPLFRLAVNCSFPINWKPYLDAADLEIR